MIIIFFNEIRYYLSYTAIHYVDLLLRSTNKMSHAKILSSIYIFLILRLKFDTIVCWM